MNGANPSVPPKIGGIYKMEFFPGDRITPKNPGEMSRNKYFVVIGLSGDRVLAASLIINSKINDKLFMRIGPYQHLLNASDYPFMTKMESYVNCFEIKELSVARISASALYVCDINPDDMKEVLAHAIDSPYNTESTLAEYGLIDGKKENPQNSGRD